MTLETLIAFGAAAIFLVMLPSPLTALVARFSLQKGRRTAFATLAGMSLGMTAALTLAALPLTAIAVALPGALDALSWLGIAYLMFYVLWSFQDPSVRGPVSDNDNLPEQNALRIFVHFVSACLKTPRYVVLTAAFLLQFIGPATALQPALMEMPAVFFFAAIGGSAIHAAFPHWSLNRLRRKKAMSPASRKLGTRFIARRAVSAGYRRIAA